MKTGSIVRFTLVASSAETASSALPGRQPVLLGKRVLLLHHNATVGAILVDQLLKWGITPHLTTETADVFDWLASGERYDLILLDQQVAGIDGRSIASAIRQRAGGEGIPLVLLSSLGVDQGQMQGGGGSARFAAYLGKPKWLRYSA